MNMPVMAKDPNRERVLRRARQSSADMKLFSTDYYDEMIKGLFLNTIEGREALEKDKY